MQYVYGERETEMAGAVTSEVQKFTNFISRGNLTVSILSKVATQVHKDVLNLCKLLARYCLGG